MSWHGDWRLDGSRMWQSNGQSLPSDKGNVRGDEIPHSDCRSNMQGRGMRHAKAWATWLTAWMERQRPSVSLSGFGLPFGVKAPVYGF